MHEFDVATEPHQAEELHDWYAEMERNGLAEGTEFLDAEADEVPVVPGGVVAHVFLDEGVDGEEFHVGGEERGREAAAEPLAVGPDVVVLGVE